LLNRLYLYIIIGGFVAGSILLNIHSANKITHLRSEINQLQADLKQCQATNQQLLNQIQIQQEEYAKAQEKLKEAYNKPAKRVYIKKVIKEPIIISNEECQQMVDLIKQAEEQLK
jgi:outer membrane murein-binding lipoprotein Lpp